MVFEQKTNNASTTLNGAINNSVTSIVVTSASGFPSSGNFRILIGSELMKVTAVSGTTWTVVRGTEGTTATTHSNLDTVDELVTSESLFQFIQDNMNFNVSQCRMTLTSGLAVTTSDVTAATNVYLTPHLGSKLSLFDGTSWAIYPFSEITIAVPATTNTPFDVFSYVSAGVPAAETVNWSSITARATALSTQDGIPTKSGDATRKYIGTGCTTGTSGQCEDSVTSRFLWNLYNPYPRQLFKGVSASHTYNSATRRAFNNSSANKFMFVTGGLYNIFLDVGYGGQAWNYGTLAPSLNSTSTFYDTTYGLIYSGTTADLQFGGSIIMSVPIGQNTVTLMQSGSVSPVANFASMFAKANMLG